MDQRILERRVMGLKQKRKLMLILLWLMNILSMILIAFTFFNSRSKKFSQLIIEKINDDPDLFIILSFIFMLVAAMSTISFYYNYLIRKERNKFLEVDEMKINQDFKDAYSAPDIEDESSISPKNSHEDFFFIF